jgi:hypothetical protein
MTEGQALVAGVGFNVSIGWQNFSYKNHAVQIGYSTITGKSDAGTQDGCIAIGWQASAQSSNNIAIGENCGVDGTRCILIDHAGLAGVISASTDILGIGHLTAANRTNFLYINSQSAMYTAAASDDNSILIGNINQAKVQIGPYTIGPGAPGGNQKIADVNYTVLPTDGTVMYTTLTAARTVTLPAANAVPAGYRILIMDMAGTATANNITINRAGADTIQGGVSTSITLNWGDKELVSDGTSKWNIIRTF